MDVRAEAAGGGWPEDMSLQTDMFRVVSTLDFAGVLTVLGHDARQVEDGGMVLAGEELDWGGLTVVYEGTTDVFPPDATHDVRLEDSEGGSWTSSPAP